MVAPPTATVMSRVIMSPGHLKRVISALEDSLKKYEDKFGKLDKLKNLKARWDSLRTDHKVLELNYY
jgi:hypothetical protein